MLIFYGLGNNEPKYLKTKHNCGRIIVENIAQLLKLQFQDTSFGCKLAKGVVNGEEIWLIYSKGYMNLSGDPLSSLVRYHKLNKNRYKLIVLQDDSDQIELCSKMVAGGRSAGHKGIDSIINHKSSVDVEALWKLKIGIRPEFNKQKSETFVLSGCSQRELEWYQELSDKIITNILSFQKQNLPTLQNIFNQKPKSGI